MTEKLLKATLYPNTHTILIMEIDQRLKLADCEI